MQPSVHCDNADKSHNTAEFAVESIRQWWNSSVRGRRANVYAMLVLWPRTTCFFSRRSLRCL
ncbi:MAG: hypothetical protein AB9879_14920 [Methanothrix sp.]